MGKLQRSLGPQQPSQRRIREGLGRGSRARDRNGSVVVDVVARRPRAILRPRHVDLELVAGLIHELEQFAARVARRESPVDVVVPPGPLPAFLQVDRFGSLAAAETGGKSIGKMPCFMLAHPVRHA